MSEATSALLGRVVDVAERALNRPAQLRHDDVAKVMTDLRAVHDKPSEVPRRTHFAVMLAEALLHLGWTRLAGAEGVRWAMIAGTLLPCVREDVLLALADERAPIEEQGRVEREIERDLMSTTQAQR